ncbi:MAG: hypothetical protein EP305_00480 [Bacteroidetes bacterium]|nr:MAG: hypothetical protein EP305_00480 [Bacteroidota bacterium]
MKIVAWILSFYIAILSLAPNMQGSEYFKVLDLVDHYVNHQSGKESYKDFMSFLNDHYQKDDHHKKEHRHLPFKSGQVQTILIANHVMDILIVREESSISESKHQPFFYELKSTKIHSGSVWNPPQLV